MIFRLLVLLVVGVCARPAINVYDGYESWDGVQPCNISGPFVINQNGPQYRRCNASVAVTVSSIETPYMIAISIESYTIALVDRESSQSFKLAKNIAKKRFKMVKKLLIFGTSNVERNFAANHSMISAVCSYSWIKREKRFVITVMGLNECNNFAVRNILNSFFIPDGEELDVIGWSIAGVISGIIALVFCLCCIYVVTGVICICIE
jgi:hypothetical protein